MNTTDPCPSAGLVNDSSPSVGGAPWVPSVLRDAVSPDLTLASPSRLLSRPCHAESSAVLGKWGRGSR